MTDTLQQKIDAIEHKFFKDDEYSQHQMLLDFDKALQEFREQLKDLEPSLEITDNETGRQKIWIRYTDVLALIGENKT